MSEKNLLDFLIENLRMRGLAYRKSDSIEVNTNSPETITTHG